MVVGVECIVFLYKLEQKRPLDSWIFLVRIENGRFPRLDILNEHIADRVQHRAEKHGIVDYVCKYSLVKGNSPNETVFEISTNMDWKEYLPFLEKADRGFRIKVEVYQEDIVRVRLRGNPWSRMSIRGRSFKMKKSTKAATLYQCYSDLSGIPIDKLTLWCDDGGAQVTAEKTLLDFPAEKGCITFDARLIKQNEDEETDL